MANVISPHDYSIRSTYLAYARVLLVYTLQHLLWTMAVGAVDHSPWFVQRGACNRWVLILRLQVTPRSADWQHRQPKGSRVSPVCHTYTHTGIKEIDFIIISISCCYLLRVQWRLTSVDKNSDAGACVQLAIVGTWAHSTCRLKNARLRYGAVLTLWRLWLQELLNGRYGLERCWQFSYMFV
jgi:hypothetical protein